MRTYASGGRERHALAGAVVEDEVPAAVRVGVARMRRRAVVVGPAPALRWNLAADRGDGYRGRVPAARRVPAAKRHEARLAELDGVREAGGRERRVDRAVAAHGRGAPAQEREHGGGVGPLGEHVPAIARLARSHVVEQRPVGVDVVGRDPVDVEVVLDVGPSDREGALDRHLPDGRRVDGGEDERGDESAGDRERREARAPDRHGDRRGCREHEDRPQPPQVAVLAVREHGHHHRGQRQRRRREEHVPAPPPHEPGERHGARPHHRRHARTERGHVIGVHDPGRHAQHDRLDDQPAAHHQRQRDARVAAVAAPQHQHDRQQPDDRKRQEPRALVAERGVEEPQRAGRARRGDRAGHPVRDWRARHRHERRSLDQPVANRHLVVRVHDLAGRVLLAEHAPEAVVAEAQGELGVVGCAPHVGALRSRRRVDHHEPHQREHRQHDGGGGEHADAAAQRPRRAHDPGHGEAGKHEEGRQRLGVERQRHERGAVQERTPATALGGAQAGEARERQQQDQERIEVVVAARGDERREHGERRGGGDAGPGAEARRDDQVGDPDGSDRAERLGQQQAERVEAEDRRTGRLEPQAERGLVDGDQPAWVRADEEEVVQRAEHRLDGCRVVLVGPAVLGEPQTFEERREAQDERQGKPLCPDRGHRRHGATLHGAQGERGPRGRPGRGRGAARARGGANRQRRGAAGEHLRSPAAPDAFRRVPKPRGLAGRPRSHRGRRRASVEAERRNVRRVDLVAVDRDVALLHVRVGHPQRHEQADQLEDDVRRDAGEHDHPERSQCLPLEQGPAPDRHQACLEEVTHRGVGEHADKQSARQSGEPVGVDHPKGVVDVPEGPTPAEVVEREVDDRARDHADEDRPQPFTNPAEGVIATSPTIIPLTLPIRLGLRPVA